MRFLMLLAVLAGCKSSPVQYEMMEVRGEKLSNMWGSVPNKRASIVLEMQSSHSVGARSRRCLLGSCRAIPGQARALLASSRIDAGGGATAEQRTTGGNQTANEGVGLSEGD